MLGHGFSYNDGKLDRCKETLVVVEGNHDTTSVIGLVVLGFVSL